MKKILIIFVNIIIMAAILTFVVLYSRIASRDSYKRQIEYFENTTVTMEQVTENYLEGEQRICDVWARYINNKTMTMQEAVEYIRSSHVLANTSAHLILAENLTGLSTRPKQGTVDDYDVSILDLTNVATVGSLGRDMANGEATCTTREASIGNQCTLLTQVHTLDITRWIEHLLHAGATLRTFVGNHDTIATLHLAAKDALAGIFLGIKNDGWTLKVP